MFKQSNIVENNYKLDDEIVIISSIMVETAAIDGEIDSTEINKIKNALISIYNDDKNIDKILSECLEKSENPKSLHSFTSRINKEFEYQKKMNLIEILWEIILADGKIHDYESNLIRRLAGLLYISDIDCGNAKKRVLLKIKNTKQI